MKVQDLRSALKRQLQARARGNAAGKYDFVKAGLSTGLTTVTSDQGVLGTEGGSLSEVCGLGNGGGQLVQQGSDAVIGVWYTKDYANYRLDVAGHNRFVNVRSTTTSVLSEKLRGNKSFMIVNPANHQLARGGGLCGKIYEAAGSSLIDEVQNGQHQGIVPSSVQAGNCVVTRAGRLGGNGFIAHAVGPQIPRGCQPTPAQRHQLEQCYHSVVKKAVEKKVRCLLIPAISTGIYNFPAREAAEIATKAVVDALRKHAGKSPYLHTVVLCYDQHNLVHADNNLLEIFKRLNNTPYLESHRAQPQSQTVPAYVTNASHYGHYGHYGGGRHRSPGGFSGRQAPQHYSFQRGNRHHVPRYQGQPHTRSRGSTYYGWVWN